MMDTDVVTSPAIRRVFLGDDVLTPAIPGPERRLAVGASRWPLTCVRDAVDASSVFQQSLADWTGLYVGFPASEIYNHMALPEVEYDIVVRLPPRNSYRLAVRIRSRSRGVPKIIKP